MINMNVNNKYLYSVVKYYSIFVGKYYMCSCSFNKHLGTFYIYNIHVYQGVRKQIFYGGARLNREKNILKNLLIFEIFTK